MPSPIAREHDVAAQRLVCKLAEREDLGGPPDRCDQLRHLRDELGVKQSFMAGLPLSSFGVDTSDDVCPVGKKPNVAINDQGLHERKRLRFGVIDDLLERQRLLGRRPLELWARVCASFLATSSSSQ